MLRIIVYLYRYIRSVIRVSLLVLGALFLPRLFLPDTHKNGAREAGLAQLSTVNTLIDYSANSYYRYSYLALLGEVAPFDIGIGSDQAHQCVLLPASSQISKNKWHELRLRLKRLGVESSGFSYYNDQKKQQCSGLKLFVKDTSEFSSFKMLLVILQFFKEAGVNLRFSSQFDTAIGNKCVREFIEGIMGKDEFERVVNQDMITYLNVDQDFLPSDGCISLLNM